MTAQVTWRDKEDLEAARDKGVGGIYYYAKVYQQDRNMAWASPVWLSF